MKHGSAVTATCWACSVAFGAAGDFPRPTGIYALDQGTQPPPAVVMLLGASAAAQCPIVDRGSPLDGVTTITVLQPPAPCTDSLFSGWQCMRIQSDANDNGVTYRLELRWNRVGQPVRGSFTWLLGGGGTGSIRRDSIYGAQTQDRLDSSDQVRSIEVSFWGDGSATAPRNGWPNISAVLAEVIEHIATNGIAVGVMGHFGNSGGSMQGMNALAYHRLDEVLDGVVFGGGPFWSDLRRTCTDATAPFFAPPDQRQNIDEWSWFELNGGGYCAQMAPQSVPPYECRSTLGVEADREYPNLIFSVIIGAQDGDNPWIDAAATDVWQNVTALRKTFDRPVAPHLVLNSQQGAATVYRRVREIVDYFTGRVRGDFDGDGDVDIDDYNTFALCYTGENGGPFVPGCEPGDFDDDGDIDCDDWAQFPLVWTGPGQLPLLAQCSSVSIPAVSHWGLGTLALLLMTAGTVVIRQTRRAGASRLAHTCCVVLIAVMTGSALARAAQSPAAGGFVPATDAVTDQEGHATSVEFPASSGLVTLTPGENAVFVEQSEVPQLPIHVVYVNHVEVESVIDYVPPLVEGRVYTATPARYAFTSGQIDWEISQAEAAGARISFHMSGAYAERAASAGHQALWGQRLVGGHTVGVHFHSFLRGPGLFQWVLRTSPAQPQIAQAWQDNHDLVGSLVGPEALWVGESHYGCPTCWQNLGYRLKSTEQMALLPAGQHIVWLVERNPQGVITYPHFPQTGQAGWHGPFQNQIYFDLRVPQLKKELLMLYLEWLERERLNLPAQAWCFGWLNHGGQNTVFHAADIAEMFAWAAAEFVGRTSLRGNLIARFVNDHEVSDIYEDYETWGQPLPSPLTNVNDQFPYMAYALEDAGLVADLSSDLGLAGIRLLELERNPPEDPPSGPPPRVYLLFRETDGTGPMDIGAVLTSRGVDATSLMLIDVVTGGTNQVNGSSLFLGPTPLVLEASYATAPIPMVSQWGLVTLTILLLTAATVVIRQTRPE